MALTRDTILQLVDDLRTRVHVYGALPTLKYLAMGGRMGKLAASVANTLEIKPVLTSRDWKTRPFGKGPYLEKGPQQTG